MSPIEQELLSDFQAILLETLVPLPVQRRIPGVRKTWQDVIATGPGRDALTGLFRESLRTQCSVAETIRQGIVDQNPQVRELKDCLYEKIVHDQSLIRTFMQRPITNGNEHCPYWDGFTYTEAPKR
ncbi:hypothetical protein [Pontibaca salina]|uniref:Uncharacterized protein n=1 Tax=Pontibaca salina TaxID=2795731 RepID=A0A934HPQ3_9RHOB|nr:hypothetical protein [Pontibaca salina]MBI6628305.1 hypothetical protein [Pontibaca salina]